VELSGIKWLMFKSLPYSNKQFSLLGKLADGDLNIYYG